MGLSPAAAARLKYTGSSAPISQQKATPAAPAVKPSPIYNIGGKDITLDQINAMSPAQKAELASKISSGAAVTSGGKTLNLKTGSSTTTGSTSSINKAPTTLPKAPEAKATAPVIANKYADAVDTAAEQAKAASNPNFSAMQKGTTQTYQAANGKKYDLVTHPDGSVTFNSQDESLQAPVQRKSANMEEAISKIQAGNKGNLPEQWLSGSSTTPGLEEMSGMTNPETLGMTNAMTAEQRAAQDILDRAKAAQEESKAEKNKYVEDYSNTAAENQSQLSAIDAERQANINAAKDSMIKNANLITDTSQRMARLESNEHLNTIMMQYMAKGMTPEEARSQAQGDIENQLQKERQTLLQAQKDGAELENQITQWGANAQDIIGQAKKTNAIQSTAEALQRANMLTGNETAAQNVEDQTFANTVQQVGLENFKTMTDLEKQKVMNTLGINQANKDVAFGVNQFLSTMGDFAKTHKAAFAAALKRLSEGKINLTQAQSEVFNPTPISTGTHTTNTNTGTSQGGNASTTFTTSSGSNISIDF